MELKIYFFKVLRAASSITPIMSLELLKQKTPISGKQPIVQLVGLWIYVGSRISLKNIALIRV